MRRIGLAVVLAISLALAPLAAQAQQPRLPRVGILQTANPRSSSFTQAFEQRLREMGYVEGRNIAFEYRNAEGKLEQLPALAADLVHAPVDVIVTATAAATDAVKQATPTIPIVLVGINADPLALGYVTSLARPDGNVTGLYFLHLDLTAKRLGLFKEMLPGIRRAAVLSDPVSVDQLKQVEATNRSLGLKLSPLELHEPQYDVQNAFRSAIRSRAEAIFVLETAHIFRARSQITGLALKHRLPTSFAFREYVDAGGLVSYGANFSNMFRLAATYVDKILKGAKPADLPVEQPTKFELVINLKTAKALGLTIPQSVLLQADEVIQ